MGPLTVAGPRRILTGFPLRGRLSLRPLASGGTNAPPSTQLAATVAKRGGGVKPPRPIATDVGQHRTRVAESAHGAATGRLRTVDHVGVCAPLLPSPHGDT